MRTKKTIWTVYFLGHVSIHVITVFWTKSVQKTVSPYIFFQKKLQKFSKKKFFVKKKKFIQKIFIGHHSFLGWFSPKKLCRPYTPHTAKMGPIYIVSTWIILMMDTIQKTHIDRLFLGTRHASKHVITVFSDDSSEKTVST